MEVIQINAKLNFGCIYSIISLYMNGFKIKFIKMKRRRDRNKQTIKIIDPKMNRHLPFPLN